MEFLLNKRQHNPRQRTDKTARRSRRIRHTPRITASCSLRSMSYTCAVVHIHRWHCYIPRVKLTMTEGYHRIEEEIGKALHEARHGRKSPILASWRNTSSQRERLDNRRRRSHKRTVPENAKVRVREWTYLHLRTGFGMQPVASYSRRPQMPKLYSKYAEGSRSLYGSFCYASQGGSGSEGE